MPSRIGARATSKRWSSASLRPSHRGALPASTRTPRPTRVGRGISKTPPSAWKCTRIALVYAEGRSASSPRYAWSYGCIGMAMPAVRRTSAARPGAPPAPCPPDFVAQDRVRPVVPDPHALRRPHEPRPLAGDGGGDQHVFELRVRQDEIGVVLSRDGQRNLRDLAVAAVVDLQ